MASRKSIRPVFAAVGLLLVVADFVVAGPATRPAEMATTRQTVEKSVSARVIDSWVRKLGSPRFVDRQAAQRRLEALGDSATPYLLRYISDSNPEIAGRIVASIRNPREPEDRVELAWRLLCTTNPDWMERAVHVIFEEPGETCDLFIDRAEDATGIDRVISEPVVSWLERWKEDDRRFKLRYEETKQGNPVAATRLRSMHIDGRMYLAEAAYWESLEALLDHCSGSGEVKSVSRATTRPTTTPVP